MTFSCYKRKPATTVLPEGLKPVLKLTNPSPVLKMTTMKDLKPFELTKPVRSSVESVFNKVTREFVPMEKSMTNETFEDESGEINSQMSLMEVSSRLEESIILSELSFQASLGTKTDVQESELMEEEVEEIEGLEEEELEEVEEVEEFEEFEELEEVEEEEVDEPDISIKSLNLNIDWNGKLHNTHFYNYHSAEDLVVRRGLNFKITLILSHLWKIDDSFSLVFQLKNCSKPEFGNGTMCLAKISPMIENPQAIYGGWLVYHGELPLTPQEEITLDIIPPFNCIIGRYSISLFKKSRTISIDENPCFNVIFNPWTEFGEGLPLEDEQISEYLLKDVGDVILGTPDKPKLEFWKFCQFNKNALNQVYSLLYDVGKMKYFEGGNIVIVSKILIKSIMDPAVHDYEWGQIKFKNVLSSSKQILEDFEKNQIVDKKNYFMVEVGFLVTAFRAIGIPSRIVTGFGVINRIENDGSLYSNKYCTTDHRTIYDMHEELWYFKPWVEIFIPRNDLSEKYADWEWVFETGPASREAIRKKDLEKFCGTINAFNSIYSGIVMWDYNEIDPSQLKKFIQFEDILGLRIFTKGTNVRTICDITEGYKLDKESLPKLLKVLRKTKSVGDYIANPPYNDLEIDFRFEEEILLGFDINFSIEFRNKSESQSMVINFILLFESIYPNGVTCNILHNSEDNCTVKKTMTFSKMFVFKPDQYIGKIEEEHGICRVCFQVRVKKYNYTYVLEKYIVIKQPPLVMTLFLKNTSETNINFVQIDLTNSVNKDILEGYLILQEIDTKNKVVLKINKIEAYGKLIANIYLEDGGEFGLYYFVARFISQVINCKVFGKIEIKKESVQESVENISI